MATELSENRIWCIYCHTTPSGKRYIGQTCQDPEIRWNDGYGYYCNKHFTSAIKKYGWKNIKHSILCWVSSKEYADFLEQWFIEKYNTMDREYGYNNTAGGKGSYNRVVSEAMRSKMRDSLRNSEKIKVKQTPVLQFDKDNNFIKRHDGIAAAAREMGVSKAAIRACCTGVCNTACGYRWVYEDAELRKKAELVIRRRKDKQTIGLPVIQYDLNGVEIARFKSTCDASDRTRLSRTGISECCRGKRKTSQGYIWRYDDSSYEELFS